MFVSVGCVVMVCLVVVFAVVLVGVGNFVSVLFCCCVVVCVMCIHVWGVCACVERAACFDALYL